MFTICECGHSKHWHIESGDGSEKCTAGDRGVIEGCRCIAFRPAFEVARPWQVEEQKRSDAQRFLELTQIADRLGVVIRLTSGKDDWGMFSKCELYQRDSNARVTWFAVNVDSPEDITTDVLCTVIGSSIKVLLHILEESVNKCIES